MKDNVNIGNIQKQQTTAVVPIILYVQNNANQDEIRTLMRYESRLSNQGMSNLLGVHLHQPPLIDLDSDANKVP